MLFKLLDYMKVQDSLRYPHRGVVVDNADPLKLRRIKCVVLTMFEDSNSDVLPWVYPQSPAGLGNGPLLSEFVVPEIGSELVITFPYRDIYFPVYCGFWETGNIIKTIWAADYPESYGFVDSESLMVRVNKTQQTAEVFHPSEGLVHMDQSGNLMLNIPGNFVINVKGNFEVHADGEVVEEAGGNIFRQGSQIADNSDGKISLKAGGDLVLEAGSNNTRKSGGNIVDQAGSNHVVSATISYTTASQIGHNSGGGGSAGSPVAKTDISGDISIVTDKATAIKSELQPPS